MAKRPERAVPAPARAKRKAADVPDGEDEIAMLGAVLLSNRTSVATALRETYHALVRNTTPRLAREGMTLRMYLVVRELWVEDGLSQNEIAKRSGAHASAVVGVVASLEQRGLAERRADAKDGRRWRVFLTPKGKELQKRILPSLRLMMDTACRGIPPKDVGHLLTVMASLRANLAADDSL